MSSTPMPRVSAAMRVGFGLFAMLALGGCDPRDCLFGIAHRDCVPEGSALAAYPQDDAICRSYGLKPGSADYAVCRDRKRHERQLTERETSFGYLKEPLTPEIQPVYPIR